LTPFPSKQAIKQKATVATYVSINIYCEYRMPYVLEDFHDSADDVKMIFLDCCKKWYHFLCTKMDGKEMTYFKIKKQEEWICHNYTATFNLLSDDDK